MTDRKDLICGVFFIAVGVLYAGTAFVSLPLGEATNMGPGFVPLFLSIVLVVLGLVICGSAIVQASQDNDFGSVPWRAIVMLGLAITMFGMLVTRLGLLPTAFVTALLASLSTRVRIDGAVFASLAIAVFSTAVFVYGLGLTIPALGSWFER
jgi:hypothetical protein